MEEKMGNISDKFADHTPRQKPKWVKFRANEDERTEIRRRAEAYALNVSDYLRFLSLGESSLPDLETRVQLTAEDRQHAIRILGLLGNTSGNLNQISVALHRHRVPGAVHFEKAIKDVGNVRAEVRQYLARPQLYSFLTRLDKLNTTMAEMATSVKTQGEPKPQSMETILQEISHLSGEVHTFLAQFSPSS